jgi:outer membrane protein assembly factor BamD
MKAVTGIIITIALVMFSCAAKTPADFDNEKELFDYGMKLFNSKNYTESAKFFETYKNKYPTGSFISESEFKLAESYFRKGDYIEAIYAFQSFKSLHPTNPKVPQAVYLTGVSYYKQMPGTIDRDQTNTVNCINTLDELVAKYPDFEDLTKAKDLVEKCKRMLAERELYIANFYLKQKEYKAALGRLEVIKNNYTFKDLREEATYKLAFSYNKLKDGDKARENLNALLAMEPSESYKKKAGELLSKLSESGKN